jgi:hypothetical protein
MLIRGNDNSSINDPHHDAVPLTEPISILLRKHQDSAKGWKYRDVLCDYYIWVERFNSEFELNIPMPVIAIECLKKRQRLGQFRFGRNPLGIKNQITISSHHIESNEYWNQLSTVLHECLHLEQRLHGKPGRGNYHNKQFRDRAASLGLNVTQRGYTKHASENSPFFNVLAKYGVEIPDWCTIDESQVADRIQPSGALKLKMLANRYALRAKATAMQLRTKCLTYGASVIERVSRAYNQI